jgi:cell division cycle 14
VAHLYRFAVMLHEILGEEENEGKAVVLYSRTNPRERANAACVLCCYMVLVQSWPPHLALAPIAQIEPPLMPFRDAGYAVADYVLTIQDFVYGVWRAKEQKLLDIKTFNLEEYELYERVDQGDFNEIPPHFVAFASPQQTDYDSPLNLAFTQVLDYFETHQVKLVVRLNSFLYNKDEFVKRGIKHVDLVFDDGTCPTMLFVQAFIGAVEGVIAQNGKVAVHCKAGLGRTGCLIGAHLIYTYGFTASEAIAYMRFLRPGMVVGPQQHWLYLHQNEFRDWRRTMTLSKTPDPSLAGFCPLVPLNHVDAASPRKGENSPPRTPERSILGEVDRTNSALPVPTPGQPRKNSPSPIGRTVSTSVRATSVGGAGTGISNPSSRVASLRTSTTNGTSTNGNSQFYENDENDATASEDYLDNSRAIAKYSSLNEKNQVSMNSDDEDDFGVSIPLKSPTRNVTESLSHNQQMLMAKKLRSVSNPSPQRVKIPRKPSYQMSTTTTTTTTTTTVSSSPPTGTEVAPRRSTRLASGGGVRKVSTGRRKV